MAQPKVTTDPKSNQNQNQGGMPALEGGCIGVEITDQAKEPKVSNVVITNVSQNNQTNVASNKKSGASPKKKEENNKDKDDFNKPKPAKPAKPEENKHDDK